MVMFSGQAPTVHLWAGSAPLNWVPANQQVPQMQFQAQGSRLQAPGSKYKARDALELISGCRMIQ
jgi:hypothetical protein